MRWAAEASESKESGVSVEDLGGGTAAVGGGFLLHHLRILLQDFGGGEDEAGYQLPDGRCNGVDDRGWEERGVIADGGVCAGKEGFGAFIGCEKRSCCRWVKSGMNQGGFNEVL